MDRLWGIVCPFEVLVLHKFVDGMDAVALTTSNLVMEWIEKGKKFQGKRRKKEEYQEEENFIYFLSFWMDLKIFYKEVILTLF